MLSIFYRINLAFILAVAFAACSPTLAPVQGVPDLSQFDSETRQSIELACISEKVHGPVAYGECLSEHINALRNSTEASKIEQRTKEPRAETGRTLILSGNEYKESTPGQFISWKCTDYFSEEQTLVEFGKLSFPDDYKSSEEYQRIEGSDKKAVDDLIKSMGFILYEGTNMGDLALYVREGLNHRWSWGPDFEYSFIIKPDGTGLSYDFTSVESGESIKANDVYKCKK